MHTKDVTGADAPVAQAAGASVSDESSSLDIGPVDIVLGILTLPLLLFVVMFAVTGMDSLFATRGARMKIYLVLLAIEIAAVLAVIRIVTSS